MILSDTEIRKRLKLWELEMVTNWDYDIDKQIWPASLDFRLWNTFKIYRKSFCGCKNDDVKFWEALVT